MRIRELILIEHGTQVVRRVVRERIAEQEMYDFWRTLQQSHHETKNPRIAVIIAERGEPHLPIKTGLMWRNPRRAPP